MVSHSLQKALGEKFREEQRFLLVSIETNSDQEGRGFLSSVHFSEAGSAAQRSGGPVWKPQSSCGLWCGVPGPVEAAGTGITHLWEPWLALSGCREPLQCHVPRECRLAGGSGAERGRCHWTRTNPITTRGRGQKRGERLKEKCAALCQN